jgi:hypothetical protein
MNNPMKGKKINNTALEIIMRDVLKGMADFTRESSGGNRQGSLEIVAVESPNREQPGATILPFRAKSKSAGKK